MNQKGFANIVLVILVAVIASAAGYFTLVKKPEIAQPNTQSNTQTSPKSNQAPTPRPTATQRLEEPFVFLGKRTSGSNADLYKGHVIVEGEYYEYYAETLGGGVLFFKVDSQYKTKLPKKYGEHNEVFAFDNVSVAKQMLKVNESVFNNKSICKLSGRAKIAIEDYTVELLESEVWDHTKLVQVISSTTQTTKICSERQ